jgi:hypothetical protein
LSPFASPAFSFYYIHEDYAEPYSDSGFAKKTVAGSGEWLVFKRKDPGLRVWERGVREETSPSRRVSSLQFPSGPDLAPEFSRGSSRFAPGVFSKNPVEKRAGFHAPAVLQIYFPVCEHEFGDEFFRWQEAN